MGNFIYYIYVHHLFWWITGKKDTYNANFYEVPLFTTTRKPREKRQKKKQIEAEEERRRRVIRTKRMTVERKRWDNDFCDENRKEEWATKWLFPLLPRPSSSITQQWRHSIHYNLISEWFSTLKLTSSWMQLNTLWKKSILKVFPQILSHIVLDFTVTVCFYFDKKRIPPLCNDGGTVVICKRKTGSRSVTWIRSMELHNIS